MEKNQIADIIASNVKRLKLSSGLSNTELAIKSDMSVGTISKILNGKMSISVSIAVALAKGFEVDLAEILCGLSKEKIIASNTNIPQQQDNKDTLYVGIMSLNNKRVACIKNHRGEIIGTSELTHGIDLVETAGTIIHLIQESIESAASQLNLGANHLKNIHVNLVAQSVEFEEIKHRFKMAAEKKFKSIKILSDLQIIYLTDFNQKAGIVLITDIGVSMCYRKHGNINKIGGWKFPVYDLGGESWLGVETVRHAIEAAEGLIPMSNLAQDVLAKYNGKIEAITEQCFKGNKDHDVYCLFTEILLKNYFTGSKAAKKIINDGFAQINRGVLHVEKLLGKKAKISLNGSLAQIYEPYFDKKRLIKPSTAIDKVSLLSGYKAQDLIDAGIDGY